MNINAEPAFGEGKAGVREPLATWAEIARNPNLFPLKRNKAVEHASLLSTCMNPGCATSWLRLWRRRHLPRFEEQWACSPECMQSLIERAVEREMVDGTPLEPRKHNHRIPLGLLMLSQGWITQEQLRTALDAQRAAGEGRIGAWLTKLYGLPEERIARALSMQWGCPVLSLSNHQPEMVAALVPRLLLEKYGMVPLRTGSSRLAYLAFEDRVDPGVALAVGRMSGLRIEGGVVTGSQFTRAHERLMTAAFPKTRLVEAANTRVITEEITGIVERLRPHDVKLVRMHRYFWLRVWRSAATIPADRNQLPAMASPLPRIHQVEDVLFHLRAEDPAQ